VFPYLVGATAALAAGIGFIVTIVARKDFPTVGDGMWWALQTITTVGYGDVTPTTTWGRVLGGVVMLVGVTFLSYLTAVVTSLLLSVRQDERDAQSAARRDAVEEETRALLREVLARVEALEGKLGNTR
jgi:voltage-gated potassium channel Kch